METYENNNKKEGKFQGLNRFETLQEKTEKSTPNDEYENFVNAHLEAFQQKLKLNIESHGKL